MRMNYITAKYGSIPKSAIHSCVSGVEGDFHPSSRKVRNICFSQLSRTLVFCLVLFVTVLPGAAPTSAASQGVLSFSPASVNFGNVSVGSAKTFKVLISNTGSATVTISNDAVSGSEFSFSGVTLPRAIYAKTSIWVTVEFKPQDSGTSSGYVQLTSNATTATSRIALTGSGTAAATTTAAVPSNAAFGNVAVGTTDTQSIQVQNHGTSALTITKTTISGTEFRIANLSTPKTLSAGQTLTFNAEFLPAKAGWSTGTIVLVASDQKNNIPIPLSGTGVTSARTISVSPSSLSFSKDQTGTQQTLEVTLKNTGNSSVTVSGISVSDPQLGTSGGVNGATLAAGQSATLNVIYSPTKAGNFSGQVKVTSNAGDSPSTISVTGSAFAPTSNHTVALKWDASSTAGVQGYYVYRSTNSSTGFVRLNSSCVSGLSYTDNGVASGTTYYYEVTALGSNGTESSKSSEVEIAVP
jgi:hypothetical protein